MAQLKTSPELTIEELAQSQGKDEAYVRRLTRLAFLAPDIQRAILDGRQPRGLTLERLMRTDPPLGWAEQRIALGGAVSLMLTGLPVEGR